MKLDANNLIIIAALGFGAYYLTTRKVSAGPVATTTAQQATAAANQNAATANRNAAYAGLLGAGIGALTNIFGGGSSQVSAAPASYYSGGQDLFAINPVIQALPYGSEEYGDMSTGGFGTFGSQW